MNRVKLSIIVTTIERDYVYILNLINSYLTMKNYEETELIILFKSLGENNYNNLKKKISSHKNIRLFIKEGLSRCERKDFGGKIAKSNKLAFVDSDCIFKEDYYLAINKFLDEKIVRGRNIYRDKGDWFTKMNSIYRTTADEYTFRNETFSPNLIIDKELLFSVGGWSEENIDYSDDYNLSQRIHRVYSGEIIHVNNAILYNQPDVDWRKTINTWKQYGIGYLYRYTKSDNKKFRLYIPPLVFRFGERIDYFFFSVFQWLITSTAYIKAFIKYTKNKEISLKI